MTGERRAPFDGNEHIGAVVDGCAVESDDHDVAIDDGDFDGVCCIVPGQREVAVLDRSGHIAGKQSPRFERLKGVIRSCVSPNGGPTSTKISEPGWKGNDHCARILGSVAIKQTSVSALLVS